MGVEGNKEQIVPWNSRFFFFSFKIVACTMPQVFPAKLVYFSPIKSLSFIEKPLSVKNTVAAI